MPYERIIVAELPKPWPRRAIDGPGASPALLDLLDRFQALRRRASWEYGEAGVKARGLNVALVHVAPDPVYSLPGHRRIFHLTRPQGPFSAYRKQEFQVPEADAAGAARSAALPRTSPSVAGGAGEGHSQRP